MIKIIKTLLFKILTKLTNQKWKGGIPILIKIKIKNFSNLKKIEKNKKIILISCTKKKKIISLIFFILIKK